MENFIEQLTAFATTYGLKVIGAILTLIIGRVTAGVLRNALRQILTRAKVEPTIIGFGCNLIYGLVLVFTAFVILSSFGIETASFVAILGAVSFAVGFALQGALSNFAAGVILLLLRPFRVGDRIDAVGVTGSIEEIGLFATTLSTSDNVRVTIPNSKLSGDTAKNFSAYDTRRVDLLVPIGYDSAIEQAHQVVTDIISGDERILADPEPLIAVWELAASVKLAVRVWVESKNYGAVRSDLNRRIKEEFDRNGIRFPAPQRVVHVLQKSGGNGSAGSQTRVRDFFQTIVKPG